MRQHLSLLFLLFGCCVSSLTKTHLPTSCIGLDDGYYDLQLLDDETFNKLKSTKGEKAPVVNAKCDNEYVIIDVDHDANFVEYFTSWHIFEAPFAGIDLENRVPWRQWFTPTSNDKSAAFSVTVDDCNTCEDTTTLEFGRHTVYHETADAVGCGWVFKCPYNEDTLVCERCACESDDSLIYWGKCGFIPQNADLTAIDDHSWCNEMVDPLQKITLPSIGITGTHCVCYKPSVDTDPLPANWDTVAVHAIAEPYDKSTVYELYQSDFEVGTYRITKSGKYIIMEDITFDFQSGDLLDPNAVGSWFLDSSMSEDYEGAGKWDGYYWLGFFAGITIETDDVTIDLQGHTLKMSQAFYLQQRYFMIITITNKIFIDGAGPTFCGYGHVSPTNVIIRDGTIGLASHMGIFGSNVTNVELTDLRIRDFETHGITLNQFKGLKIENVEIGPSINGQLLLNGDYNLARFMLPTLRAAAIEIPTDAQVSFDYNGRPHNGPYTYNEMLDNLVRDMDIAFHWAYFGERKEGVTDAQYKTALETYTNPLGVSRAGSLFGLVLRPKGASVFNWGQHAGKDSSYDAILSNVYIHDLVLAPEEIITLQTTRSQFSGPFAMGKYSTDPDLGPYAHYVGCSVLDILISMRLLNNNWWYLGRMLLMPEVYAWAFNGKTLRATGARTGITCGMDTGGHTPKGVVGMKFERSQNVQMEYIRIENLINAGERASSACGSWSNAHGGGNIEMSDLWSSGYYGTHARAMSIYTVREVEMKHITIKNIMSLYGPSFGMFIHQSDDGLPFEHLTDDTNTIKFKHVKIKHIDAGIAAIAHDMDLGDEDYEPNWSTEACAISCEYLINEGDDNCKLSVISSSGIKISEQITGQTSGCSICNTDDPTDSCLDYDTSDSEYTKTYNTPLGYYTVGTGSQSVIFTPIDNEVSPPMVKGEKEKGEKEGEDEDEEKDDIIQQMIIIKTKKGRKKENDNEQQKAQAAVVESESSSSSSSSSTNNKRAHAYSATIVVACSVFGLIFVVISIVWCYFYYRDTIDKAHRHSSSNSHGHGHGHQSQQGKSLYQPLVDDDTNTYLSTF